MTYRGTMIADRAWWRLATERPADVDKPGQWRVCGGGYEPSILIRRVAAVALGHGATDGPGRCSQPGHHWRTSGEPMHIEGHASNEYSGRFFGAWRHSAEESPGGGMTGAGIHVLEAFILWWARCNR
jgi:hypothetical protein